MAEAFEHAVLAVDGDVTVDGEPVPAGHLAYLAPGRASLELAANEPAVALLLGGTPFPDQLVMWWNYVARTRDEVAGAHAAWTVRDPRFGSVASSLDAIDVGPPPWSPAR